MWFEKLNIYAKVKMNDVHIFFCIQNKYNA